MPKRSSAPRTCSIEGCGRKSPGRSADQPHITPANLVVPVCTFHAVSIWRQVQITTSKSAHVEELLRLQKAITEDLGREPAARKPPPVDRQMVYFVRLNDLIKVGWSGNLSERFRAYGPSVEILCHYPGSRKDETELHQILTPFRAKGREWYTDSPMIRNLIAEKINEHGPPHIAAHWSEPPKSAVKPRYWAA